MMCVFVCVRVCACVCPAAAVVVFSPILLFGLSTSERGEERGPGGLPANESTWKIDGMANELRNNNNNITGRLWILPYHSKHC